MTASRRQFIRVLGGGAVIAAAGGLGLTRCDLMPEEAIAAWQDPFGAEVEPRRRALGAALLAPNPHNMQPWIADLRQEGVITFLADRTRLLPATDPYSRQIVIGCGAFLELLRMAAAEMGYRAETRLFPDGAWTDEAVGETPLARVTFAADPAIARDPLFAHVLRRRSNRNVYEARHVEARKAEAIAAASAEAGTRFGWTGGDAHLSDRIRDLARRAWAAEVGYDESYYESVRVYRLTATEIAAHRDGLSLHGPLIWWLNATGIFTREKALSGNKFLRDQALANVTAQIDASPSFGWIITPQNDRPMQIAAGRAYVRANLAATGAGVALCPLSQILEEFPAMQALQREFKETLGVEPAHTVQMLFRMGYATEAPPSPRRRLGDIVLA
ncbi:MAG: nitroreductase family protein [Alphaproteobacteria bacterium]|nr:nitroreductase family protein [Alphaproteobacteria bacterium]